MTQALLSSQVSLRIPCLSKGFCNSRACYLRVKNSSFIFRVTARSEKGSNERPQFVGQDVMKNLASSALILVATAALTLTPVGDAEAAKSSGRVGGSNFRSRAPPRAESSRSNNVYVAPSTTFIAPPVYGGYYSPSPFFGGWSPFSYGPTIAVSGGGFLDFFFFLFFGSVLFSVIRGFFFKRDD